MLHFAYGSNMSREPMRQRCPEARNIGCAILRNHRFVIMANGYATVVPQPAADVQGVLWRVSPRDLVSLDAYENIAGGLYLRSTLPVTHDGQSVPALVYIGAEPREGAPRKGYMELVIAAARENGLSDGYIERLSKLAPGRFSLSSGTGGRM
ncbi:MAG: gamma-glutamylcyclotransferase family protein [Pseudorhodoplanes sp.]